MAELITAAQVKKIWAVARHQLGWDEDLLRTVVENITGSNRISALTKHQANRVIDDLDARANGRPGMATKRQIWKIRRLEAELGWDQNPKRLRAFLKKYYKVERPEWLRFQSAWRAIESLKRIKESGQDAASQ